MFLVVAAVGGDCITSTSTMESIGQIMPPNIISCNYKDVLTGRVHVFDLTNLC
jgi:hypothetical protein